MSIRNVTGSLPAELEFSVKKATKEENEIPKPKHLKNIQLMLEEGHGNVAAVLHLLDHRMHKRYWPITYKSLLVLHWFCHVDSISEKWYRALMLNLNIFHLDYAQDESSAVAFDNTRQMRAFGLYMEKKVSLFHALHVDATSSKAHIVEAFKTLPYREEMIERLDLLSAAITAALKCDFAGFSYYEPLPCAALEAVMEDLRNLCAASNALVASMLKQFFGLPKEDAQRCLTAYRSFADTMTQVQNWFHALRTTCRAFRLEAPTLSTAPLSLASTLKAYIESPDFEVERLKYLETNPSQDGEPVNRTPPKQRKETARASTTTAQQGTSVNRANPAVTAQAVAAPAPKKDNLIDFFDSIDNTPAQMPAHNTWQPQQQPQQQQSYQQQREQPAQQQQQQWGQSAPQNDFFGGNANNVWGASQPQQQQGTSFGSLPAAQGSQQQQHNAFFGATQQYTTTATPPAQISYNNSQAFAQMEAQQVQQAFQPQAAFFGTAAPMQSQVQASPAASGFFGPSFAQQQQPQQQQPQQMMMQSQQQPQQPQQQQAFSSHSFWQAEAQSNQARGFQSGYQQQQQQSMQSQAWSQPAQRYNPNVNPFAELMK